MASKLEFKSIRDLGYEDAIEDVLVVMRSEFGLLENLHSTSVLNGLKKNSMFND